MKKQIRALVQKKASRDFSVCRYPQETFRFVATLLRKPLRKISSRKQPESLAISNKNHNFAPSELIY